MTWKTSALDVLASHPGPGYARGSVGACEPTALTALALSGHGRKSAANDQLARLTEWQAEDGSLGVTQTEAQPAWPTSLAVIAWEQASEDDCFTDHSQRCINWLLSQAGEAIEQHEGRMGHDTTLVGWPWVIGTHSWMEPTAFALLALKATGNNKHPRAREAAELLIDRLLPDGGCNYGNTFVLGQELRPHVQPSGLVMLALAGEATDDPRPARTLAYLRRNLTRQRGAASLCYAVHGLAAHDELEPVQHDSTDALSQLIGELAAAALAEENAHRLALLLLAELGSQSPLIPPPLIPAAVNPCRDGH